MKDYDVIVIGSGPGGSSVAGDLRDAGKKVAVVDRLFGGTCALRGCTPKKAMEAVTSAYWQAHDFRQSGFPDLQRHIDWHQLMAHKAKFTAQVPANTKANFEEKGIDPIVGWAEFVDDHSLKVDGKKYTADHIVIATGARPAPLDIPGEDLMVTTEEFFELSRLPEQVVVVGGGYIAFELAHIMAACGKKITILSDEQHPLDAFDAGQVDEMVQGTLDKGIRVEMGFAAKKIEEVEGGLRVQTERSDGEIYEFHCDMVIHAAGRVPAVKSLKVESIGIELNEDGGVEVDEFLTVKGKSNIYALGDVIGKLPFTDVAHYEANVLVHNILQQSRIALDYTGVPLAMFTYPKLAKVGRKANELDDAGIEYEEKDIDLSESFIQRTHNMNFAQLKVLSHKENGQILGAFALGYGADDLVNVLGLALQQKMTMEELKNSFFAYPTLACDVKYRL